MNFHSRLKKLIYLRMKHVLSLKDESFSVGALGTIISVIPPFRSSLPDERSAAEQLRMWWDQTEVPNQQ